MKAEFDKTSSENKEFKGRIEFLQQKVSSLERENQKLYKDVQEARNKVP